MPLVSNKLPVIGVLHDETCSALVMFRQVVAYQVMIGETQANQTNWNSMQIIMTQPYNRMLSGER